MPTCCRRCVEPRYSSNQSGLPARREALPSSLWRCSITPPRRALRTAGTPYPRPSRLPRPPTATPRAGPTTVVARTCALLLSFVKLRSRPEIEKRCTPLLTSSVTSGPSSATQPSSPPLRPPPSWAHSMAPCPPFPCPSSPSCSTAELWAEEQCSASCQWRAMAANTDATLRIDPHLCEDAHLYIDDKLPRVQAVDATYPLPLLPNGLPKFPPTIKGSVLSAQVDVSEPEMPSNDSNRWSAAVSEDLKRTAQKLCEADVEIYLGWACNKERESMRLVVGAPILAAAAAVLNLVQCIPPGAGVQLSWAASVAAACSVVAMLSFSFARGGQIGMIFEMYRNYVGSYADLDNNIQRALRIPVCLREDGELFHAKVAQQLRSLNVVPLVRLGDKTTRNVF